jgi:hypothetical protein
MDTIYVVEELDPKDGWIISEVWQSKENADNFASEMHKLYKATFRVRRFVAAEG